MSASDVLTSAVPRLSWSLNPFSYRRRKTTVVMVGSVAVGGDNPLRVQSMTTTDTMSTDATVAQVRRLADVGCEIARITAPTVLDARNLEKIKSALLAAHCDIPLVADIHFRPDAAMAAADFVEKVRINPGNFVDGKAFKIREYTDDQYADELKRIEDKFTPLVLKLKKLGRALRIGTNHGSLSDRIMNRFGDTPLGMVESALEYVRICERNDYTDIILSMKASNPRVMVAAYRLLAKRMADENMAYPFHLGVTEAGDGPDGRIKSAAGIGSLLEDGIGDTIRVSLTEEPELEIPVAYEIARRYSIPSFATGSSGASEAIGDISYGEDPISPARRRSDFFRTGPIELGRDLPIRVVSTGILDAEAPKNILAVLEDRLKQDAPPEILAFQYDGGDFFARFDRLRSDLMFETQRLAYWIKFKAGDVPPSIPVRADGFLYEAGNSVAAEELHRLNVQRPDSTALILTASSVEPLLSWLRANSPAANLMVGIHPAGDSFSTHAYRRLAAGLRAMDSHVPIFLLTGEERPSLATAAVLGSLICDGIGDAIGVASEPLSRENLDFAYNLLQACGNRSTKTDYVSCPSCGRTLFDLQSTTERIKSKTGHLKGVKIAIMGCIVNGPGEMADADFGYVGGGPGKINLYVGKTCVEKSIPSDIADEKLIELIKGRGRWMEPPR